MKSFAALGEVAVVNCETTGLRPPKDRLVEITILCANLSKVKNSDIVTCERLTMRVNTQDPIPRSASRIHGISDADVAYDDPFGFHHAKGISEFIGKRPIIAHNAQFDLAFLNSEFDRVGHPRLNSRNRFCTMKSMGAYYFTNFISLSECAEILRIGGRTTSVHSSAEDALIALKIAIALRDLHQDESNIF